MVSTNPQRYRQRDHVSGGGMGGAGPPPAPLLRVRRGAPEVLILYIDLRLVTGETSSLQNCCRGLASPLGRGCRWREELGVASVPLHVMLRGLGIPFGSRLQVVGGTRGAVSVPLLVMLRGLGIPHMSWLPVVEGTTMRSLSPCLAFLIFIGICQHVSWVHFWGAAWLHSAVSVARASSAGVIFNAVLVFRLQVEGDRPPPSHELRRSRGRGHCTISPRLTMSVSSLRSASAVRWTCSSAAETVSGGALLLGCGECVPGYAGGSGARPVSEFSLRFLQLCHPLSMLPPVSMSVTPFPLVLGLTASGRWHMSCRSRFWQQMLGHE